MVGKLWPMELCTKIEERNRKMIDTEEFLEATGIKGPKKRWFVDATTSTGPADWIQKEIRDNLAMTKALLPDTMKKDICNKIREEEFKDYRDGLRSDFVIVDELDTMKKDKKENNMFNNSQFYYDRIKDHLQVTNMSVTESNGSWSNPEIRVEGFVPTDILHNLCNTNKKEYDKMYKNAPKMPKPTGIIRRDNTTRVDWDDKTYTIIVLEEGKEDLDMFHTFCIAFTKKMFGSTTNIMKAIEENDTDTIERERAEAIKKAEKEAAEEARKEREAMERKQFEEDVRLEMYDHRVREEAIRRIMLKEGADIRKTEKIIDRFVKE